MIEIVIDDVAVKIEIQNGLEAVAEIVKKDQNLKV
jgi:hypothetical protein